MLVILSFLVKGQSLSEILSRKLVFVGAIKERIHYE